jgi:dipeptidyl aminopeptidase/acylaminoacyl peptidase
MLTGFVTLSTCRGDIVSPPTENQGHFSRRYWLRLITFTVGVSIAAGLFLLAYFIWLQLEAFVTPRRNETMGSPAELGRPFEAIVLTTQDGLKISGWYIVGTRPQAMVLVHGIDANRQAVLPEAAVLADAGYHLLMIDLRGHGQSEGDEATYGYREAWDVQAAIDYLENVPGIEQIGALGTSYGGAAVVRAAAIDPRVQTVVVESTYSSLTRAIDDAFGDRSIFPRWPFAPLFVALAERRVGLKISQVDSARDLATLYPRPVMIIHGADDPIFPLHHAQTMYAAAHGAKELWIVAGLGHGNPAFGPERAAEYKARVLPFLERAFNEQR